MQPVPFEAFVKAKFPDAAQTLATLCRPGHEDMKKKWRDGVGGEFIHWRYRKGRPVVGTKATIGRNAPCPCGSGSKFKKCCMDA